MKLRFPDHTSVYLADGILENDPSLVSFELTDTLNVRWSSSDIPVRYLRLRWNQAPRAGVKVLGDAWERAYGDLEWRGIVPERRMPWYFAMSNGSDSCTDYTDRLTECFGVSVGCNSIASWQVDGAGVTLWLDLRCGTAPTTLARGFECATVLFCEYTAVSAFSALRDFCHKMSPKPCLADRPVYGANNWYYAYGESSHEDILEDSRFVKMLCEGNEYEPYMVIDDGWQPNHLDAPWDRGNDKFPDMRALAAEMKRIGVLPGIWVRYLINGNEDEPRKVDTFPEEWYLMNNKKALDPSHPKVLSYVKETTRRFVDWGYRLIKHDFSTYDIFGRWGFAMGDSLAHDEWSFYDKSLTTAQVLKGFYRAIKEAAGNTVIIGCNVVGHLCAGLHQVNRIGDDTSGKEWSRTLKMGVNTVSFRIGQDMSFYGADADCVGITGEIDWSLNRQWLDLISQSDSALFVSCKPGILSEEELRELREAMRRGERKAYEWYPLDWMETVTPSKFMIDGTIVEYHWYADKGFE